MKKKEFIICLFFRRWNMIKYCTPLYLDIISNFIIKNFIFNNIISKKIFNSLNKQFIISYNLKYKLTKLQNLVTKNNKINPIS
jgi:hypothetical protein